VNEDQHFALILIVFFGVILPVLLAVGIPLGKAWARKLESGSRPAIDPSVLEELHQLRERVGELEERLDFTERVVAQQRESTRLTEGGG
jgi:hypothetical protein